MEVGKCDFEGGQDEPHSSTYLYGIKVGTTHYPYMCVALYITHKMRFLLNGEVMCRLMTCIVIFT